MPFKGDTVIVAVSGGADSVSLLLAIDDLRKRKKLELRVVAAHFDHKLRPDSRADFEFVKELAGERKFELAHGEWHRESGGNLEQSARQARYDFLLKTARNLNAGYILTAHTMNDQAETVLMNLIRGSGADGLGGMRPTRPIESDTADGDDETAPFLPFSSAPVLLVRPLLAWATRRDTEGFCHEMGVEYRRDPMNEDVNFRRVWLRKVLIPMIEEMNPKIIETLCHTAELLRFESSALPQNPDAQGNNSLTLRSLTALETPDQYTTIRDWLRQNRGNLRGITQKHIAAIASLAAGRKSGRVAEVPGGTVVKGGGQLEWRENTAKKG